VCLRATNFRVTGIFSRVGVEYNVYKMLAVKKGDGGGGGDSVERMFTYDSQVGVGRPV